MDVRGFLLLLFIFILIPSLLPAQNDSLLLVPEQVIKNISTPHDHSPKRATLMSALLPGLGQVYNRKYWKVPIIYGGLVSLAYMIDFNQKRYQTYRQAYIYRTDNNVTTVDEYVGRYSDDNLKTLKDFYRRNRDLSYIATAGLYILQILDASVDAHLFTFNVSDNLSLRIMPAYCPFPLITRRQTGGGTFFTLSLHL